MKKPSRLKERERRIIIFMIFLSTDGFLSILYDDESIPLLLTFNQASNDVVITESGVLAPFENTLSIALFSTLTPPLLPLQRTRGQNQNPAALLHN